MSVLATQWSTPDAVLEPATRAHKTTQVRTARLVVGQRVLFGRGDSDRGRIGRPVRTIAAIDDTTDRHGRRQYILRFTDGDSTLGIYGSEAISQVTTD